MSYKIETTLQDGRVIIHKDVIHTNLSTEFTFLDKIKILFGKKLIQHVEIYTNDEAVNVIASQTHCYIEPFFYKKEKGYGMELKDSD